MEAGPDAKDFEGLQAEIDDLKQKCDSDYKESNKIFKRHEELLKRILTEIGEDIETSSFG